MVYLVSQNKTLFESALYKMVSFEEALTMVFPVKEVQIDSETVG